MPHCLLDIDLGELPGEDEALYALAHVANIACGGHAGDAHSMRRALERCRRHGTLAGAHPSYVDRAGFGRQEQQVPPDTLRAQVASQCAELATLAAAGGQRVTHAKPHGALYHAAARQPAVARAVVDAVRAALGPGTTLVGLPGGALREAAREAGLPYAREGFADRGTRPDGSLIPRGQPGAVLTQAAAVRHNALRLATGGTVDILCVHGDTPGAVALAREVRAVLDALASPLEPLGEAALRLLLPPQVERRAALEVLRALPRVTDVVLAELHACLCFHPASPPGDPRPALAALLVAPPPPQVHALRTIPVRYDGPDLARVAARAGLSEADVVLLHAAREYSVRSVGFLPGFAYLGEVDPRIATPRLDSPRTRVPALSVGLAGSRTGVYPFASPGGWNLLGTALGFTAFEPVHGATLQPGDRVRFEQVP